MSYKITKERLAEIVKEEMDAYFGTLEEEGKKPDEDGDGVPDYADKKPGKDDHAEKEGDKKGKKKDLSKVPPQLRKSMKKESLARLREMIKAELESH